MNGIQTVDFLPGSQARELGFGGEPQLPLTDVSAWLHLCVCVCLCVDVYSHDEGFLPRRITRRRQTTRRHLRRTWTPAVPMTTWRTPWRTATVSQAAASTTSVTGPLSAGPILVAMATSHRSKPSCRTQRRRERASDGTQVSGKNRTQTWASCFHVVYVYF